MKKRNFKFLVAILVARTIKLGLKLFKKNATQLPGKIAIRICPDFLGRIGKPEKLIAVTGTNGKTTVSNMLTDILTANGYNVLDNKFGGNINSGIASSLISGSTFWGKAKHQVAVFETDERSSRTIYPYITPDFIICTNLFRDSMPRNAHTEYIFDVINNHIPLESKLILNADDLISSNLGKDNYTAFFGIDKLDTDTKEGNNIIQDIKNCPICDSKLEYDYLRYHHIGKAHCPNCEFKSKESDYLVNTIDFENKILRVNAKENIEEYRLIANGIFNIYNQIAVISVLKEFGLDYEKIKQSFENFKIVESRFSEEKFKDISVVMQMAKGMNSVACSRAFDYFKHEPGKKAVILNLDDLHDAHDSSENIVWIYDIDYELLNDPSIAQVIIGGVRHKDHYLRALLADIPVEKIFIAEKELDTASLVDLNKIDKVFITYDVYTVHIANEVKDKLVSRINSEVNI